MKSKNLIGWAMVAAMIGVLLIAFGEQCQAQTPTPMPDNDKFIVGVGVRSAIWGADRIEGNTITTELYGGIRVLTLADGTKFHVMGQHLDVSGSTKGDGVKAMMTVPIWERGNWALSVGIAGGWLNDFARQFTTVTDEKGISEIQEIEPADAWNADIPFNIIFKHRLAVTPSLHLVDRGEDPTDPSLRRKPGIGVGLNISFLVSDS